MKLIIHDLEVKQFERLFPNVPDDVIIISNDGTIKNCIGCFGCWIKTPGVCAIRDHYGDMGELLAKSDEVVILSKCFYGGYSPFVKNVLDRSISYIHPYFEKRNNEMHHKKRYNHKFETSIWFYGDDITDDEKATANKLVVANSINMNSDIKDIQFVKYPQEIEGGIL
jgi:multimeric flavodoxin WrbA